MSIRQSISERGIALIPKLFSPTEIDVLLQEILAFINLQIRHCGGSEGRDVRTAFETLKALDPDRWSRSLQILDRLSSVRRLVVDSRLIEVAKSLDIDLPMIPSNPLFHPMSNDLRSNRSYFGFDEHQDWSALQGSLRCLVFWVAMTDLTIDSFPLEFALGSHKKGKAPGRQGPGHYSIDPDYLAKLEFTPLTAKQGDVYVFSHFVVHRTCRVGDGFRLGLSVRFEDASESSFIARNLPSAFMSISSIGGKDPEFPSLSLLSAANKIIGQTSIANE